MRLQQLVPIESSRHTSDTVLYASQAEVSLPKPAAIMNITIKTQDGNRIEHLHCYRQRTFKISSKDYGNLVS